MKTKNDSEKGKTPENTAAKNEILKAVKFTEADLLKKIEELEKKLNGQPQSLDEKIKFFELKKQRINHLNLFEAKRNELSESLEGVTPAAENEDFQKEEFQLQLKTFSKYGDGNTLFKITNPLIIQQCMSFIISAIDKKIVELKMEIEH